MLFNIQGAKANLKKVSVTNAEGPPVPIPNTEVKLCSGDNTLWETAREDSSMLTQGKGTVKPFPSPEKNRVSSLETVVQFSVTPLKDR